MKAISTTALNPPRTEANELQKRINQYRQASDKPLLLEEVGYHSWADDPAASRAEEEQADTLGHVIRVAEAQKLAGWVIWTAFDFVPAAGQPPNEEHFFGLWRTDLTPKPALEALPLP
jgi:hypothetical protein